MTLVDAARSYGLAEERIGRHLARHRSEVVLSTKVGYGVDGVADWTGPCVAVGIDEALRRLRSDWLDIVHLHSCPVETLRRGDVLAALLDAVVAGKVRVAAYSGEGEALAWAVASGAFDAVQSSVNLCDRASLTSAIPAARERGVAVLAKRALCNGVWRHDEPPPSPTSPSTGGAGTPSGCRFRGGTRWSWRCASPPTRRARTALWSARLASSTCAVSSRSPIAAPCHRTSCRPWTVVTGESAPRGPG